MAQPLSSEPTVRVRVRVPVILAMETAEGAREMRVSISRYWTEWLKMLHDRATGDMTVSEVRAAIFKKLNGENGRV